MVYSNKRDFAYGKGGFFIHLNGKELVNDDLLLFATLEGH